MCTNTPRRLSTHDYAWENEWSGIEEQTWCIATQTLRICELFSCIDLNIAQWMCDDRIYQYWLNAQSVSKSYGVFNNIIQQHKKWNDKRANVSSDEWQRLVSIVSKPIVRAKPQKLKRKFIIEMCE